MMGVRCGRCGTQFPVEGAGRYPCPSCGAVNEVRPSAAPEPSLTVPPPAFTESHVWGVFLQFHRR